MDSNDLESQTKPLISSMKVDKEKVEVEERILMNEEDDTKRLLPYGNGRMSKGAPHSRRKVQWNDINGDKLAEILEYQPSDASDSDDEDSDSCYCTIM